MAGEVRRDGTEVQQAMTGDGRHIAAAVRTARRALARCRDDVDAHNVFPVPDGNTGTNMAFTCQPACAAADASVRAGACQAGGHRGPESGGGRCCTRGSSGLIVSQRPAWPRSLHRKAGSTVQT
jgi:dihydroxyacetone kinase-like predicted kinase